MTALLILVALAAVVAMLLTADRVKSSGFEWSLLAVSALVQLALRLMHPDLTDEEAC